MSEYFRILNRVEKEEPEVELDSGSKPLTRATRSAQQIRPTPVPNGSGVKAAVGSSAAAPKAADKKLVGRAETHRGPVALSGRDAAHSAFAQIFDSLRAGAKERRLASVVVAPASHASTVFEISKGVGAEAHRHNLQVAIAELSDNAGEVTLEERARLVAHPDTSRAKDQHLSSVSFSLAGGPVPEALSRWLAASSDENDLIIVEGPALDASIDSALVAKACDGLVIVVEPNVTTYDELTAAVDRCRQVGCNVLGLVMNGTEDLPTWVRHILT
jgi:hypothetical protein